MKKAILTFVVLAAAVLAAACGGNDSADGSSQASSRQPSAAGESGTAPSSSGSSDGSGTDSKGEDDTMKDVRIKLSFNDREVVANLEDNPTSRDFLALLPMTLKFEDYSGDEKIAYPPGKLSTEGASAGYDPSAGDLTLYAPWGDIAIFYKDFGYASGLIKLGHIDSGIEKLAEMDDDFTATIERID